jgi:hypothetical protein
MSEERRFLIVVGAAIAAMSVAVLMAFAMRQPALASFSILAGLASARLAVYLTPTDREH